MVDNRAETSGPRSLKPFCGEPRSAGSESVHTFEASENPLKPPRLDFLLMLRGDTSGTAYG